MLWRYDPTFVHDDAIGMDDFRDSVEHLRKYGAVAINNYVRPECGMYGTGGHGDRESRREQREWDIDELSRLYGPIVRRKPGEYPDLRVAFTSPAQVEKWRRFWPFPEVVAS